MEAVRESEKLGAVTLRHRCSCGAIHIMDFSKHQIDKLRKAVNSRPRKAEKLLQDFAYDPKIVEPEQVEKILESMPEAVNEKPE